VSATRANRRGAPLINIPFAETADKAVKRRAVTTAPSKRIRIRHKDGCSNSSSVGDVDQSALLPLFRQAVARLVALPY